MPNPLFAVPLNMGTGTWIVTIVAGLSFVVMFGIASAFGDFQGLVNTTLENDSNARESRNNKKWRAVSKFFIWLSLNFALFFTFIANKHKQGQ